MHFWIVQSPFTSELVMTPAREEHESSFFSGLLLKYFKTELLLTYLKAIEGMESTPGLLLSPFRLFQYLDQLFRNAS